jgi:hypothetical protein
VTWLLSIAVALSLSTAELQNRLDFGRLAYRDLVAFCWLSMPAPGQLVGMQQSRYSVKPHHRYTADALQRVESGLTERLEIELPTRMGKSEIAVRRFVPWFCGHHPERHIIVTCHTDQLATEHGRDCREIFRSPAYQLTFGDRRETELREDTQAADRLQLRGGGVVTFTGRSGLGAGVGADLLVVDDLFKNTEEAESPTVRDAVWRFLFADCFSRLNTDHSPVVMIGTRRNEDDPQGRLFDRTNPNYDEREAARWTRIRLPALAEENDPLGRAPNEALWAEKFSAEHYLARRNHKSDLVRIDHQTQDQCNPTPAEGYYFKQRWLTTYLPAELPKHLRIYAASDHAYRKEQRNDSNCLLVVGIDPTDTIWVLPESFWQRCETDVLVDEMLKIMSTMKPATWFAARDAISGSIGPFLKKRQLETKTYTFVDDDLREDKDLMRRAQSIRGRMAMGCVRWPSRWAQWGEAEKQLITFPNGKHDDLVAALAVLGMGLDKMIKANTPYAPTTGLPKTGTLAWVKQQSRRAQIEDETSKEIKGW